METIILLKIVAVTVAVISFFVGFWKFAFRHIDERLNKMQAEFRADNEILHKKFNNFVSKDVLEAHLKGLTFELSRLASNQERTNARLDRFYEMMSKGDRNG